MLDRVTTKNGSFELVINMKAYKISSHIVAIKCIYTHIYIYIRIRIKQICTQKQNKYCITSEWPTDFMCFDEQYSVEIAAVITNSRSTGAGGSYYICSKNLSREWRLQFRSAAQTQVENYIEDALF